MKTDTDTSPEYQRFENLLKTVLSVPHSEIKRQLDDEKKAKAKIKKRAKTSPASRVSNVPRTL
jgi:hypothetical protein